MAKKNKTKTKFKDMPIEARNRIMGCILCLIALITAFVVGWFVGSFMPSNKANAMEKDVSSLVVNDYDLDSSYLYGDYYYLLGYPFSERYADSTFFAYMIDEYLYDVLNITVRLSFADNESGEPLSFSESVEGRLMFRQSYGSFYTDYELCFKSNETGSSWQPIIYCRVEDGYTFEDSICYVVWDFRLTFPFVSSSESTFKSDFVDFVLSSCDTGMFDVYAIDSTSYGEFIGVPWYNISSGVESGYPHMELGERYEVILEPYISLSIYPFFIDVQYSNNALDFVNDNEYDLRLSFDFAAYNNVVLVFSYLGNPSNICTFDVYGSIYVVDFYLYNDYGGESYNIAIFGFEDGLPKGHYVIVPREYNYTYKFTVEFVLPEPQNLSYTITGSTDLTYSEPIFTGTDLTYYFTCLVPYNSHSPELSFYISSYSTDVDIDLTPFFAWFITPLSAFMDFSILPGLSLGVILGTIIMLSLIIWILKVFAGG